MVFAAHRAHEKEDLRWLHRDAQPLEGSVHLRQREHARARVVELEERVVQQQAALPDGLARARHLGAQLEHRPLVLEGEELRERRRLPILPKTPAARDDHREEEAARDGLRRDGAQQHVELIRLEVHRRVDESEAIVAHARLVARRDREVVARVEDGVARRQAAQRERDVRTLDERAPLAHVHDRSHRLGLGEREQHKVTALVSAPVPTRREHVVQHVVGELLAVLGEQVVELRL